MKHTWTLEELQKIYDQPLLKLISEANVVHTEHHDREEIQVCSLISIKTGGCSEDCKYCAQSSRYQTATEAQPLMSHEAVLSQAKRAVQQGASRVCLGAAWRGVREGLQFEKVLNMIKEIADLGVEVCCTLGMLNEHQAKRLKDAGLYAYNHNLDTSENYYKTIITTRTYQDRLTTLDHVEKAGLSVCCGAILGLGETVQDRLELIQTLSQRSTPPESVPLNRLVAIPGTPLEERPLLSIWEFVRIVALARIVLPKSKLRLSAGRLEMSYEEQALCFLAGANSIFAGEKLLTVANPPFDRDGEMLKLFGLKTKKLCTI